MNPYSPADSRYDLWPTHDVTYSDRPQRYAQYKYDQYGRGRVFTRLNDLADFRQKYAYWRKRDYHIALLARDAFYGLLDDVREMAGPKLPRVTQRQYLEAAE